MGDVSRKAFRIVELDGRKCGCVAEQDFHQNFRVSCTCFFAFSFFLFDWIVLILLGLKNLFPPLSKLLKCPNVISIDHDNVTSDTRDMDPHGWIWVVQWRVGE